VIDSYDYSQYSATTCVFMVLKKFEMQQFKLDMPELLDPTKGTLVSSQKDKLDKIMGWDENPICEHQCKKKKNKNYYYLVHKGDQLCCADCQCSRVSIKCSTVRCKMHCVENCIAESLECK
jgi:hypothetical protein